MNQSASKPRVVLLFQLFSEDISCFFHSVLFPSFWQECRLEPGVGADGEGGGGGGGGNKGKHLSNLQRAHWYVEWTLVCGLRLRLFQGKTISFL